MPEESCLRRFDVNQCMKHRSNWPGVTLTFALFNHAFHVRCILKKRSLVVYHFSHYCTRHISWQQWVKQFASPKCALSRRTLWRHLERTGTGWGKAQTVVVLMPSETRGSQHLITIRWMQLKGQPEPFLASIPTRRLQGRMSVCLLVNTEICQQHQWTGWVSVFHFTPAKHPVNTTVKQLPIILVCIFS